MSEVFEVVAFWLLVGVPWGVGVVTLISEAWGRLARREEESEA